MVEVKKPIRVIIIGAGIAGLATAYGLKDVPGVQVRIFEKRREEESLEGGYPIHLSLEGRRALQRLLSSEDYLRLLASRNAFPACHDGIAILNSKGKMAWRMVQSPGEKCLMERQALIDILKEGLKPMKDHASMVDEVEDVELENSSYNVPEMTVEGERLLEKLETGRNDPLMEHDLPSSPRPPVEKRDTFGNPALDEKTRDLEVELRTSEKNKPTSGSLQIEYGKSVKTIQKISGGWSITLWDGEIVTCDLLIGADGMFSIVRRTLYPPQAGIKDQGHKALPYTIINLRATTPAVRRWLGDEDCMNLIYGKGWSAAFMALDHRHAGASERQKVVSSDGSPKSASPSGTHTYVAITIPHPRESIPEAISLLSEAKCNDSFIHDLLADPGLKRARAFPLWTSRQTCVGGQRAVLIGDASHGMVPYCGAGASAGLADAAELVDLLHNHLTFGGGLDYLLDEFGNRQKKNNDPLIAQSRKVLWIAQGDNWSKRILRSVAFGALEIGEKMSKQRKEAEKQLVKWKR